MSNTIPYWPSLTSMPTPYHHVQHYIKREDGRIGKFDSRVDKGIFIEYSNKRKAYKCFNLRLNRIVERINVQIDETSV
jgi:hypothetical protein